MLIINVLEGEYNILKTFQKLSFKIKFNFYFLALLTFILVMDKSYTAVLGILFSFIHELGHIMVLFLKQIQLKEISFGLVNVDILEEDLEVEDYNQLLIFLGGPLINLILALVFIIVYTVSNIYIFNVMSIQNFLLGIINLFPIKSLDGGKILSILLSQRNNNYKVEKILNLISIIFLIPICLLGVIILIKSRYNLSLLILSCYLVTYVLFK